MTRLLTSLIIALCLLSLSKISFAFFSIQNNTKETLTYDYYAPASSIFSKNAKGSGSIQPGATNTLPDELKASNVTIHNSANNTIFKGFLNRYATDDFNTSIKSLDANYRLAYGTLSSNTQAITMNIDPGTDRINVGNNVELPIHLQALDCNDLSILVFNKTTHYLYVKYQAPLLSFNPIMTVNPNNYFPLPTLHNDGNTTIAGSYRPANASFKIYGADESKYVFLSIDKYYGDDKNSPLRLDSRIRLESNELKATLKIISLGNCQLNQSAMMAIEILPAK